MKKIVLIDDYKDYIEKLQQYIEFKTAAKCITFTDPVMALRYLTQNKDIDILITDFEMPRFNGLEVARELIRKKLFNIRIIVNSSYTENELQQKVNQYNLTGKVEVVSKGNFEKILNYIL